LLIISCIGINFFIYRKCQTKDRFSSNCTGFCLKKIRQKRQKRGSHFQKQKYKRSENKIENTVDLVEIEEDEIVSLVKENTKLKSTAKKIGNKTSLQRTTIVPDRIEGILDKRLGTES
jgi:hypothetical protein